MQRRPLRSTRTYPLFPYPTLFRSIVRDRMGGHHRIGRLLVDRIGERRHHAPFRCGWARLPDVGKAFLIAAKTKPPFSLETGGGGLRDPLDRAPAQIGRAHV